MHCIPPLQDGRIGPCLALGAITSLARADTKMGNRLIKALRNGAAYHIQQ
jgi:hypothetical protein